MEELLNGSLAQAIEALAYRATERRAAGPTIIEKQAALGGYLSALGNTMKENPTLSHALAGSALGAGAGGIGTAWANRGKDPEERRSVLGSTLTGGLAGAGVGAGAGLLRTGLSNLQSPKASPGSSLGAGQFIDPETGQKMRIDPEALKANPGLISEVRKHMRPTTQSAVAGGVGKAYDLLREQAPTTTSLFPYVAGADAAMHLPGIGLARATPETASGYWGRKFLSDSLGKSPLSSELTQKALENNEVPGKSSVGSLTTSLPGIKGRLGKFLEKAVDKTAPGGKANRVAGGAQKAHSWLNNLVTAKPKGGVRDILGGMRHPGHGDDPVLHASKPMMRDETHQGDIRPAKINPHTGAVESPERAGKTFVTKEPVLDAKGNPQHEVGKLNLGQLAAQKGKGAEGNKFFEGRNMYRLPGTNRMYRGAGSVGGALGGRALAYGLPVGAEWLLRGVDEDVQNQRSIRDIMKTVAKPTGDN